MEALAPYIAPILADPRLAPVWAATGIASMLAQAAALAAATVLLLLLLRSVLGALLRPKDLPPTLACLPLVGGFVKFLQASRPGWPATGAAPAARAPAARSRVACARRGRCR